jgi:hypothetical protein
MLVVVGGAHLLRRDVMARVWTGYVLLFFAFVAHYHLLYVRHHLVIVPWLAVLFASGVRRCAELPRVWLRRAVALAIAVGFAMNMASGARAALSIARDTPSSVRGDFLHDIEHGRTPFRLSGDLAEALEPTLGAVARCSAVDPTKSSAQGSPSVYFFYSDELFWKGHINNGLDGLVAFYGPMAANYDWYISFIGKMARQRIVGVRWAQAKAMDLDMSDYRDCVPSR